jgi:transcriptional regulator with XRE-family HTH domain
MVEEERQRPGAALKAAIHVARERAGITSDRQLALKAGVSYDTLMNWYAERTTPRPAELKKVGDTVGVRLVELMDVWEGRDPQPPTLEERMGEMLDELRALSSELRLSRHQQEESTTELMRALGALARGGLIQRGTRPGNGSAEPADKPRP